MFRCGHIYGEVREDGFQYCTKCGKATEPEKQPCSHKWVIQWEINNYKGLTTGLLMVCTYCGELKNHKTTS